MARNPGCAVFIGNLDEKVPERVLYEILVQVGRVVDLHIPRDKETNRGRGYAFAEYETEEIAQYAVKLFSGLVRLHNRTLRFAISGQDKPSSNANMPVTPKMNPIPLPNPPQLMRSSDTPVSQQRVVNGRVAGYGAPASHSNDFHAQASSGVASRGLSDVSAASGSRVIKLYISYHLMLRCNCCYFLRVLHKVASVPDVPEYVERTVAWLGSFSPPVTKRGETIVGTEPNFPEVSMHLIVGSDLNFIEAPV